MLSGYYTYEFVLFGAMLVSILANPVLVRLARKMRLLDQPGLRKVHAAAIPRIGGAAIVFAAFAVVLPILGLDNLIGAAFRQDQAQLITILAGGLLMFGLGLIDDIRPVRPRVKLACQLAAALAVCAAGVRIDALVLGDWSVSLGLLAWPVTLVWIVGVTNAVNLIDGLDGLAAGIATITCGVLALFALHMGLPVLAVLMLALVGGLVGFLFLNFNPARIFMGDCGSLFLGFVISAASVRCAQKSASVVGLALPFLALGVPIFDTLLAILRRTLERRGIFSGDRGHIHHRLLDKGLRQHQVALLIYVVTLIAAGMGLFMLFLQGAAVLAIFGMVLIFLLLVFRAAGAVRWHDSLAAYRRRRGVLREARAQRQEMDSVEVVFRDVHTLDQWWSATCQAAGRLGFLRLTLELRAGDGAPRTLVWQNPAPAGPAAEGIHTAIRLARWRFGQALWAEADVSVTGSVESAGRRIALFGRLLDEHGAASLTPASADQPAKPQGDGGSVPTAPAGQPPAKRVAGVSPAPSGSTGPGQEPSGIAS